MSYIENNKIPIFDLDEKELKNRSLTDMVTRQQRIPNKFKELFLSHLRELITTKLLDHIEKKYTVRSNIYSNEYNHNYPAHFNKLRKLCLKYLNEINQQNLRELARTINKTTQETSFELHELINIACAFESYNIFNGMLDFFQKKNIRLLYLDYGNFDSYIKNNTIYIEPLMNHSSIFSADDLQFFSRMICDETNNYDVLELMAKRWPSAEYISALTKRGRADIVLNLFHQGIIPEQELTIDQYEAYEDGRTGYILIGSVI